MAAGRYSVLFGWRVRRGAAALALFALAQFAAEPALAADRFVGPFGGRGGAPFQSRCPQGSQLTGFKVAVGAWITGIAPLCSVPYRVALDGKGQGDLQVVGCPQGSIIRTLEITLLRSDNHLVDELRFSCSTPGNPGALTATLDVLSPQGEDAEHRGLFHPFTSQPYTVYDCGSQVPVGIQGRAGDSVDALGLICGDAPVTKVGPGGLGSVIGGVAKAPDPTCKPGYVWRAAVPGDQVCVSTTERAMIRAQNAENTLHWDPRRPPYCLPGYVWRAAAPGDQVCVLPGVRAHQLELNVAGPSHRVGN